MLSTTSHIDTKHVKTDSKYGHLSKEKIKYDFELEGMFTLKVSDLNPIKEAINHPKSSNPFSLDLSFPHARPGKTLLNYLDNKITILANDINSKDKTPDSFIKNMKPSDEKKFSFIINDLVKIIINIIYKDSYQLNKWVSDFFSDEILEKIKASHGTEIFEIKLALSMLSVITSIQKFQDPKTSNYFAYCALSFFIERIIEIRMNVEKKYYFLMKKYFNANILSPRNSEEKIFFNFSRKLLEKTAIALKDTKNIFSNKITSAENYLDFINSIYLIKSCSIKLYSLGIHSLIEILNQQENSALIEKELTQWMKEKYLFFDAIINYYFEQRMQNQFAYSLLDLSTIEKQAIRLLKLSSDEKHETSIVTFTAQLQKAAIFTKQLSCLYNKLRDPSISPYSKQTLNIIDRNLKPEFHPRINADLFWFQQEVLDPLQKTLDFAKELETLDAQIKIISDEKDQKIKLSPFYGALKGYLWEKSNYFQQLTETPNKITYNHVNEITQIIKLLKSLNYLYTAGRNNVEDLSIHNAKKQLYLCSLELAFEILKRASSSEKEKNLLSLCETLDLSGLAINKRTLLSIEKLESHAKEITGSSNCTKKLLGAACILGGAITLAIDKIFSIPTQEADTTMRTYHAYGLIPIGICFFTSGIQKGLSKKVSAVAKEIKKLAISPSA